MRLASSAAAVCLAAAVAPGCGGGDGPRSGGPLACPECHASLVVPVAVDHPVSDGMLQLRNHGVREATLEDVRLIGISPGLDVLGTYAVRIGDLPASPGVVAGARRFPPYRDRSVLHAVRGMKVEPDRGDRSDEVQLVVGVRAQERGRFEFRGLGVAYRVGSQKFVDRFDLPFAVCTPEVDASRCPAPKTSVD